MGYDVGQYVIDELSNKIVEELKTAERLDYLSRRKECAVSSLLNEEVRSLREGGLWFVLDGDGNIVGYKVSHINQNDNSQTFSELFEIKNTNDKIVSLNNSIVSIGEDLTLSMTEKNLERTFCLPVTFTEKAIQNGGHEIRLIWNGVSGGTKTLYIDIRRGNTIEIEDLIAGNVYTLVFLYEDGGYTLVLTGQSIKKATTEKAGIVQPDGDTIKITEDGILSVDYAFYTREDPNDPRGEKQKICPLPHTSTREDYAGGSSTTKWGHVRIHEEKEVQDNEIVVDEPEQNVSYVPSYKEFFKTKDRAWKNKKEIEINRENIEKTKKTIQNNLFVNANFKLTPDGKTVSKSGNFNYFELECPEQGSFYFENNGVRIAQNQSAYKFSQYVGVPQIEPRKLSVSLEVTGEIVKENIDVIICNEDETKTLLDTSQTSEETDEKLISVEEVEISAETKRFYINTSYTTDIDRCKISIIVKTLNSDIVVNYIKCELGDCSDYYNETVDEVARKSQLYESDSACKEYIDTAKGVGANLLFNSRFALNTLDFNPAYAKVVTEEGKKKYCYNSNSLYPISFDGWFIGQLSSIGYSGNFVDGYETVEATFRPSLKDSIRSPWLRQFIYNCGKKFKNKKLTLSIKYRTTDTGMIINVGGVTSDKRTYQIFGDYVNGKITDRGQNLEPSEDFRIESLTVTVPNIEFDDIYIQVRNSVKGGKEVKLEIAYIKLEEGVKSTPLNYSPIDEASERSSNRVYVLTEKKIRNFNLTDSTEWNSMNFPFPRKYAFTPIVSKIVYDKRDSLFWVDPTSARFSSYSFSSTSNGIELNYIGGNGSIYSYSLQGLDVGGGHCLKGFGKEKWIDDYFYTDPTGKVIGRDNKQRALSFSIVILEEKPPLNLIPWHKYSKKWFSLADFGSTNVTTSNNDATGYQNALSQGDIETPSTASSKSWFFECKAGVPVFGQSDAPRHYNARALWVGFKWSKPSNGVIRVYAEDTNDSDGLIMRQELPLINDTEWHAYVFDDLLLPWNKEALNPTKVKIEILAEQDSSGYLCGGEFFN